jgi:hypothetical protein
MGSMDPGGRSPNEIAQPTAFFTSLAASAGSELVIDVGISNL